MDDETYEDVSPHFAWVKGNTADTLQIDIAGVNKKGGEFEKRHLLVQVDDMRNVLVSGRRQLDGRRWRRFRSSQSLPAAADPSRIRAVFDGSLLSVIIPKLAAKPDEEEQPLPAREETREKKREEKKRGKMVEFRKKGSSEGELVVNAVAAAAVLLWLALYLVYRYWSAMGSRKIIPLAVGP